MVNRPLTELGSSVARHRTMKYYHTIKKVLRPKKKKNGSTKYSKHNGYAFIIFVR